MHTHIIPEVNKVVVPFIFSIVEETEVSGIHTIPTNLVE